MPYPEGNASQRLRWHRELADSLGPEPLRPAVWSAALSAEGTVHAESDAMDGFAENVVPHLEAMERRLADSAEDAAGGDDAVGGERVSATPTHEEMVHLGAVLLGHFQGSQLGLKISRRAIEAFLNGTAQRGDGRPVDFGKLRQFVADQNESVWNPDHQWFHDEIRRKRERLAESTERVRRHRTYHELLQLHRIEPSYRFHGHRDIVEAHRDEPWARHYVDDDSEWRESEPPDLSPSDEPEAEQLSAHDIDRVVGWDTLDRIQQHFLQNGDHRAMKRFISSLSEKQSLFLKWALFCFARPDRCDDGHHPFELVGDEKLSAALFGERFPWSDMLRVPSFANSVERGSEGLFQLQFVSLGMTQQWTPTAEEERNHIPSKAEIKRTADELARVLSLQSVSLIAGGVELSRGHVPRSYQRWIECVAMGALQRALHRNTSHSKMKFLRYEIFVHREVDEEDYAEYGSSFKNIPSCLRRITSPYI